MAAMYCVCPAGVLKYTHITVDFIIRWDEESEMYVWSDKEG